MLLRTAALLILTAPLACSASRPREGTEVSSASRELPPESFRACAEKVPGAPCVLQVDEIEALGVCAPAHGRDRRLVCDGQR